MNWPDAVVSSVGFITIIALFSLVGFLAKMYTLRYQADVRQHISDNELAAAKIPRSIFGSGERIGTDE